MEGGDRRSEEMMKRENKESKVIKNDHGSDVGFERVRTPLHIDDRGWSNR